MTDPTGTVTYAYDGTDAAGKTDRRGLVTTLTVTRAGSGGALTYQGAYDEAGTLVRQDLPGQVTATVTTNELKQPVGQAYAGQITPVTATTDPNTGEVTWTPGTPTTGTWLAWSIDRDGLGRIAREYTGAGAGFDGDPGIPADGDTSHMTVGNGSAFDRAYTYDPAGPLTKVTDRTATAGSGPLEPSDPAAPSAPCQVRTYGFTTNGARSTLKVDTHADGDCASTTGVTSTSIGYSYDSADRFTAAASINGTTAGAYVYDALGRQTIIPGSDAPGGGSAGNITLTYYADDLPASVSQAGVATSFTLDSAGRRATQSTTGGPNGGTSIDRHYGDDSDNPAWETTTPATGAASTTRFTPDISGDLGAMITDTGEVTIALADPHGDNVTAISIPAATTSGTACVGITGWNSYTEYGQPTAGTSTDPTVTGPLGYGWLGSNERATGPDTAGLTLMGVRYYNPATGTFTGPDPIPGGNDTSYGYPNDPTNKDDVSGLSWAIERMGGAYGGFAGARAGRPSISVNGRIITGVSGIALANLLKRIPRPGGPKRFKRYQVYEIQYQERVPGGRYRYLTWKYGITGAGAEEAQAAIEHLFIFYRRAPLPLSLAGQCSVLLPCPVSRVRLHLWLCTQVWALPARAIQILQVGVRSW
ncbi:hypothetical protein G9U51_05700 [Calidifontibacter sp. DB0510]|uniref:RHS repeat-associated core domain-containing protein n=1 Tax=Metallococcus carri TaxID=1656884 RepID=A0A967E8J2_9MICO|nr:hypothetical protein [Metallococcus carri]NHN55277.1 hypothetical protein [Metallococcus carri]NOP36354.1 hypothetical protein [Calidifontibacter sp. DB2511S]